MDLMTVMPCQCGAKNEPDVARVRYTAEQGAWQVRCLRCKASSSARDSQADAVNAWNRLAMAVQITEAAWLGRETTMAAQSCRRGSIVSPPGATLERAARGLVQKLGDMLDQWGEDLDA